ncbi:MAG: response regulator [Deltaproteobacteria bacterium]
MSVPQKSLLIVDDEENVRRALARALRDEGCDIRFAGSGVEALELLAVAPSDMVLSDHLMPRMTGLELMHEVRQRYPDTMRMILTGYADLEMAISAINDGEIYRFLTKPWDPVDLQVTVRLGFERLLLERENRRLLATVKRQSDFLRDLEESHPGISSVARDGIGAVVIDDEELLSQFGATLGMRAA